MNYFDEKEFVKYLNYKYQHGFINIDNIDNFDFVGFAEQYGLNNTNWLNVINWLQIVFERFGGNYNTGRGVVLKYADPDGFATKICIVTNDFTDFDIIRDYMEQRIKPNEQRKFLDRCLAELNYYAAKHYNQNQRLIEQQKHIIESLKQIVANRPTTATQAQSPNASEQTPQVTTAELTEGNKHTIKEIVRWFNNYDAFKGKFDEQQIIECVEHADFNPVYTDRQKVWVRDLICTIKKNLPIDANIFTQIAQNLGFQNMSQLSKSRGKHKKYSSTN